MTHRPPYIPAHPADAAPPEVAPTGRVRAGRGKVGRLFLGGLVSTVCSAALIGVPVVSGADEDASLAAARKPVASVPAASVPSGPVAPRPFSPPAPAPTPAAEPDGSAPVAAGMEKAARSSRQGPAATQGTVADARPAPAAPPAAPVPPATLAVPAMNAPACDGPGRTTIRPSAAGTLLSSQWKMPSTPDNVTYDLTGVTSTAYPATKSPFAVGVDNAGLRTCIVGGTILGQADEDQTWEYYHDEFNAACVKVIAVEWMQVRDVRCDNVEDGIKPQESGINANNAQFFVTGTHLSRIRDDCMENDYTVGGLLHDNLWEQCNTGISERPSSDRSWPTPASETLVLDRMLIGLYKTPHIEHGKTVTGENAIFKWSESGNRVVIKCSIFKVDEVSLNGTDTMAMPPGTVVDDSDCPDTPSTIVWLGGGDYPGWTAGMRVVSDLSVWTDAVTAWKARHGD